MGGYEGEKRQQMSAMWRNSLTSLKSLINGALIIEKNADEKGAPFDRQDPEKNEREMPCTHLLFRAQRVR